MQKQLCESKSVTVGQIALQGTWHMVTHAKLYLAYGL